MWGFGTWGYGILGFEAINVSLRAFCASEMISTLYFRRKNLSFKNGNYIKLFYAQQKFDKYPISFKNYNTLFYLYDSLPSINAKI